MILHVINYILETLQIRKNEEIPFRFQSEKEEQEQVEITFQRKRAKTSSRRSSRFRSH